MNENPTNETTATEAPDPWDHPATAVPAPEGDTATGEGPVAERDAADAANPALSANSGANSDSDSLPTHEGDAAHELAGLRAELKALKDFFSLQKRQDEELAAFRELYPDTPLDTIPDRVWEEVKGGLPLAAAYALAERRRAREEALAASQDARNRQRSAGPIRGSDAEEYSLEEVRRMSRGEVRAHLSGIRRSMQKWGKKRF